MSERFWKIVAIIFVVLSILETTLIVWAINLATEEEQKEKHCIVNVCSKYPSYVYDTYTGICGCYDYQGDLKLEVYLNGL